MKKKEIPPIWATAYDQFGDPSETFTASREGLVYLKEKIDEALLSNRADVGDAYFDFRKIAVSEIHPSQTLAPRPILDRAMRFLGLSVIAAALFLMWYGAHALYLDLTK